MRVYMRQCRYAAAKFRPVRYTSRSTSAAERQKRILQPSTMTRHVRVDDKRAPNIRTNLLHNATLATPNILLGGACGHDALPVRLH